MTAAGLAPSVRTAGPPEAAAKVRRVLLGGCEPEAGAKLAAALAAEGFSVCVAGDFEETLCALEAGAYDLWILEARRLGLGVPMVWASFRYASAQGKPAGRGSRAPPAPVLVLSQHGDASGVEAVRAVANIPSITGWNQAAWSLGLLEAPRGVSEVLALAHQLLDGVAPAAR